MSNEQSFDPPFSQHSSLEDAFLTDANKRQIDSQQNEETSTDTDYTMESNDNLSNSQILDPETEPPTSEMDQQ
jgi:hypothetical protein